MIRLAQATQRFEIAGIADGMVIDSAREHFTAANAPFVLLFLSLNDPA
ncbi:hypothetical protein [Aporhodopirellula aestuarii]|uniref:Uncharacterized protein n=1 Tax=Aporhodopirellula aestuarii TaxID=2950107 RepID=A0ABT0TWQ2_9BACT|nr:hypothetical protein [Aporhodopirellula aestuarii]MCM2369049.1 hypothetical protein [Aporhodopirellula aestuarii]